MIPAYQPAPAFETIAGEPAQHRGCRILAYVLAHRSLWRLAVDDLRLADHVYPIAIAHPEILPAAVDQLSAVRHWILRTIAERTADRCRRLAQLQGDQGDQGAADQGDQGGPQPAPEPTAAELFGLIGRLADRGAADQGGPSTGDQGGPHGGQLARLQPAPRPLAPAGAARQPADIEF